VKLIKRKILREIEKDRKATYKTKEFGEKRIFL